MLKLLLASAFLVACGTSPSAAPASPPPLQPGCDVANEGPLVGYTFQNGGSPPPMGGALADGVYDLVQMIDFKRASGQWSSDVAPALRMTLRFTTDVRSPNHTEGRISMSVNLPPAVGCDVGRFATVGPELRAVWTNSKMDKLATGAYTATPDTLVLHQTGERSRTDLVYILRKRP